MELEQIYRRYIEALNERRFGDLAEYVHDQLTYNGEPWTLQDYQALLVDDVRNIPDLRYDVRTLVVDRDLVACRLWFDCHPQHEFHGIRAGGRGVAFAEHVFYRFRDHRITDVWSLIDIASIQRQLSAANAGVL